MKNKWIMFGNNSTGYSDRWICPKCRKTCRSEMWHTQCEYTFCPNCGEKLITEDHEDNSGCEGSKALK